jgi:tetratricopeptide (TPR) repeat protein
MSAFAQAVRLNSYDAHAHYNFGLALQYLNKPEEAIVEYLQAIDLDPMLVSAYTNVGALYLQQNMLEFALEVSHQLIEIEANNTSFILLGDVQAALHLDEEAVQSYRHALILDPADTHTPERLHEVRERINAQYRKLMLIESQIDDHPDVIEYYVDSIRVFTDMHQYTHALSLVNYLRGSFPDNRTIYDMYVIIYEAMGDGEQAHWAYEHLVELVPDDMQVLGHLAAWQSLQGDDIHAIDTYLKALSLKPDNVTVLFDLAETYMRMHDFAQAEETYCHILSLRDSLSGEDEMAANIGHVDALNALEKYQDAIVLVTSLLQEEGAQEPEMYYQRARAYIALQQYTEAYADLEQSLADDPLNADYAYALAETASSLMRYVDTEEYVRRTIALEPDRLVAYELLEKVLRIQGRVQEATSIHEQILVLNETL